MNNCVQVCAKDKLTSFIWQAIVDSRCFYSGIFVRNRFTGTNHVFICLNVLNGTMRLLIFIISCILLPVNYLKILIGEQSVPMNNYPQFQPVIFTCFA